MPDVTLVSAAEAHERQKHGQALLVCAYDSDEKFNTYRLEGAISLSEFASRLDAIDRDRELIFYCN
ncbi:rhodanese-like domain-containing protein [Desulfofustis limnaeus]|jgi:hypothetical protein|uniref:ArsR family transcriptional regulator n=1 Tax=Desulfofustis limnaeus TaxID=2740163 RepID=A0ABM7W525_9BACT|nr:hypothetical protein [Desulfofustis limnaeus]BDD86018.1 hypothetical protein DPPLL_03830 [Desulfofustis limnaeus]